MSNALLSDKNLNRHFSSLALNMHSPLKQRNQSYLDGYTFDNTMIQHLL